jgi:MoxR-like ATPase
MLYKFKSKATADLIMTEPVGDRILRLIGRAPTPKGILAVGDMPAALEALHAAIEADEAIRRAAAESDDEATQAEAAARDHISLRQRAWPFVEMVKRAQDGRADIVWGV